MFRVVYVFANMIFAIAIDFLYAGSHKFLNTLTDKNITLKFLIGKMKE